LENFSNISTSLDIEDAIFDFILEAVKRPRRRTGNYAPILGEDAVVAWTMELIIVGNPPNPATEVGANVGKDDKFLPILC
jgi:hypothetical protein